MIEIVANVRPTHASSRPNFIFENPKIIIFYKIYIAIFLNSALGEHLCLCVH